MVPCLNNDLLLLGIHRDLFDSFDTGQHIQILKKKKMFKILFGQSIDALLFKIGLQVDCILHLDLYRWQNLLNRSKPDDFLREG